MINNEAEEVDFERDNDQQVSLQGGGNPLLHHPISSANSKFRGQDTLVQSRVYEIQNDQIFDVDRNIMISSRGHKSPVNKNIFDTINRGKEEIRSEN